jgi:hypothetical protein
LREEVAGLGGGACDCGVVDRRIGRADVELDHPVLAVAQHGLDVGERFVTLEADPGFRGDLDDVGALERQPAVLQPLRQLVAPRVELFAQQGLVPRRVPLDLVGPDAAQEHTAQLVERIAGPTRLPGGAHAAADIELVLDRRAIERELRIVGGRAHRLVLDFARGGLETIGRLLLVVARDARPADLDAGEHAIAVHEAFDHGQRDEQREDHARHERHPAPPVGRQPARSGAPASAGPGAASGGHPAPG